jgi:hypothetical protein
MAKTGKDADKDSVSPEGMTSLGDAAGLADGKTPCEVMGQNEILPHEIVVNQKDRVTWRVFLCNTPAKAVLGIADGLGHHKVLVNQTMPPPNPLSVAVMPPPPPHGRYVLIWTLFPTGPDWQMVVEVAVNGAVVFRQFKGAKSKLPVPRGFLFMEVV